MSLLDEHPDGDSVPELRAQALTTTFDSVQQQLLAFQRSPEEWQALGYTRFPDFVHDRLGKAVHLPAEERRELVAAMTAEGVPVVDQAAILGVTDRTIRNDKAENFPEPADETPDDDDPAAEIFPPPDVEDAEDVEDPDIMAGHPDPKINAKIDAQIDAIKAGQFAGNVMRLFAPMSKGRAQLKVERIVEVARFDQRFDRFLRDNIAWAREWFDEIEQAMGTEVVAGQLRSVR